METTSNSTCPICGKPVEGHINHQYARKGAEFAGKAAAKYGAGAIGGAVGGILGPVGSIVGSAVGKVVAENVAKVGSEYIQDKYTAKYHNYFCSTCECGWKSTDNRIQVINDYYEPLFMAAKKIPTLAKLLFVPYIFLFGLELLCLLYYALNALIGDPQFFHEFQNTIGYIILTAILKMSYWLLPIIAIVFSIIFLSNHNKTKDLKKRMEASLKRENCHTTSTCVVQYQKPDSNVEIQSDNVVALLEVGQKKKAFVEYYRESGLDMKEAKAMFDKYCLKNGY